MIYSIRIGFLIAILSVIVGAGIYQNFQVQSKTTTGVFPENFQMVISSHARSLAVTSWAGDLEKTTLFKHFLKQSYYTSEVNYLWPNRTFKASKQPTADVITTQNSAEPKLTFTLSLVPDVKTLWPNSHAIVKSDLIQKNSLIYFPAHSSTKRISSNLTFSPSYPEIITQAESKLFPHRYYLYIVRPPIVQGVPRTSVSTHVIDNFMLGLKNWFSFSGTAVHHRVQTQEVFTPAQFLSQHKNSPVLNVNAPLPLTPISIQSAALMGDVGHTQLILRLSQQPFYIIRTDVSHQTITLAIDNVNPDLSAIPPLDTQGTAIQNISFNMTSDNQFLITLTLLPQMDVQGLRYKDNNLVIDLGMGTQIPYIPSQNTSIQTGPTQPLVKVPAPLTPEQLAQQNYGEAIDLYNQGNTQGAIGLLQMMLSQHPDFLNGRVLLANLLLQQGEVNKALHTLQSVEVLPDLQQNVTYYNLLAEAYRQSGHLRAAMSVYQKLLSMDNANGVWWVGLGMCFEGLNQQAAANEAYQRAQQTANLSPVLQSFVLRKLGSIT